MSIKDDEGVETMASFTFPWGRFGVSVKVNYLNQHAAIKSSSKSIRTACLAAFTQLSLIVDSAAARSLF